MTIVTLKREPAWDGAGRLANLQGFCGRLGVAEDDVEALDKALLACEPIAPAQVLGGAEPGRPFLIVNGWAALQRTTAGEATQILAFFVAGDLVGLDTATVPISDGQIIALTPMKIRWLGPGGRLQLASKPGLVRAIAADNLQHQARLQDQILRLGAMSAFGRTAHLLAELSQRLEQAAGSTRPQTFPLRQEIFARALGLSLVHINRTLKVLRQGRWAMIERGCLCVPDRAALLSASQLSTEDAMRRAAAADGRNRSLAADRPSQVGRSAVSI